MPETSNPIHRPQKIDLEQLAEWYGEIISTFNKIYFCCETGNAVLAFVSAVNLQHELNDHVQSLGFDILSDWDIADLGRLSARAKAVEAELVEYIESGAVIKRYASVDQFLAANQ